MLLHLDGEVVGRAWVIVPHVQEIAQTRLSTNTPTVIHFHDYGNFVQLSDELPHQRSNQLPHFVLLPNFHFHFTPARADFTGYLDCIQCRGPGFIPWSLGIGT